MLLPKKEIEASVNELKELIRNTQDEEKKKEYNYFLFRLIGLTLVKDKPKADHRSYTKKIRELEDLYSDNIDFYQTFVDYDNSLSNDRERLDYLSNNYESIDYQNYKLNKKQSISLARNFYRNLDPEFLNIVDDILNKKTLTIKKKVKSNYNGTTIFVGGINKNYIEIQKHNDFQDYLTMVHEFGHAINNIYNPMSCFVVNYLGEFVSLFMGLVALYEGRGMFDDNLLTYHNIEDLLFYQDSIFTLVIQKEIVDLMYQNQFNKFNKQFISEINNSLHITKKDLKKAINHSFIDMGDYDFSYIMALELLHIYKQNKKEALELLKELMIKIPLDNQLSKISTYLKPNVNAYTESKEIIDSAHHILKKTL